MLLLGFVFEDKGGVFFPFHNCIAAHYKNTEKGWLTETQELSVSIA